MAEQKPRGIVRLENVVERVAPRDPGLWEARPPLRRGRLVSGSRARQLRATVRQLALAVGHEGMPEGCGRSVQQLLAPQAVDTFLELAAEGAFRDPDKPKMLGKPLPWSTRAMLRDCLVILGEEAGVRVVVPKVWRHYTDLAPVADTEQLGLLYDRLVRSAGDAPVDALMARALACAGLVLDSRMRSGDLASRLVEHVHFEGDDARVDAVWTAQGSGRSRRDAVVLSPGTVAALERWLRFRRELVAGLQGSDHGMLWVTVQARARRIEGEYQTYEAGMPLRAQGLRMGFASGMARLNEALASRWKGPGPWSPFPLRVEQWRRGADAEPKHEFVPLTDVQWRAVEPIVDVVGDPRGGWSRRDHRVMLDAIAWRFQTFGSWTHLPAEFGPPGSAFKRLRVWRSEGVWDEVVDELLRLADCPERVQWAVLARDL